MTASAKPAIVGIDLGTTYSLVFGGTADWLSLKMQKIGHAEWYPWYRTALIFVSVVVYARMRDTKRDSALDRHR